MEITTHTHAHTSALINVGAGARARACQWPYVHFGKGKNNTVTKEGRAKNENRNNNINLKNFKRAPKVCVWVRVCACVCGWFARSVVFSHSCLWMGWQMLPKGLVAGYQQTFQNKRKEDAPQKKYTHAHTFIQTHVSTTKMKANAFCCCLWPVPAPTTWPTALCSLWLEQQLKRKRNVTAWFYYIVNVITLRICNKHMHTHTHTHNLFLSLKRPLGCRVLWRYVSHPHGQDCGWRPQLDSWTFGHLDICWRRVAVA